MSLKGYLDYRAQRKRIRPDVVEVGFGNADFLIRLAEDNPNKLVCGVEVSDTSIRKLLKKLKGRNIDNLFFAKIDAFWGFQILFEDGSIEKIYMNYPDPWFKKRHTKRRITRREALCVFSQKLKEGGEMIIRTDELAFVCFTLEQAEGLFDAQVREVEVSSPRTKYERKWVSRGKKIYEILLKKVKGGNHEKICEKIRRLEICEEDSSAMVVPKEKGIDEVIQKLRELRGVEIRLRDRVVGKVFDVYVGDGEVVVEALVSEEGFVQKFFVHIGERDREYIIDVSGFSEILRTKGVSDFIKALSRMIFRDG